MRRRHALAVLAVPQAGRAQAHHEFDEAVGRIGFSARHIGLVRSFGEFRRYCATLLVDPIRPTEAAVAGEVESADDLLRSASFFDAARHPGSSFEGRATGDGEARLFAIAGRLTVRAITRPFALQARLRRRERDAEGEVAACEAMVTMRRSEFGMVTERVLISDAIALTISVRLRV